MDRTFINTLPTVDVTTSVREHLRKLLNARQGSLVHLPDYGLPDLGEIYQKLPESLPTLKQILVDLIHRYEPRLHTPKISYNPSESVDVVIALTIYAELCNGQKIYLDVNFLSNGIVFLF